VGVRGRRSRTTTNVQHVLASHKNKGKCYTIRRKIIHRHDARERRMTTETIDAIFEHGTFRLIRPPTIPLRDGQRVRLVVETEASPDAILALAANVYAGLSAQDIKEVEQIALQRQDFFGDDV
jgi:predicted DNA-binding antitoxin AbrB/MazE fold protein